MGRRRHPGSWKRGGRSGSSPDIGQNRPDLEADLAGLRRSLVPFSIDLSPEAQDRILRFSVELLQWNDRLNLLSRPDAPNVIRKHVAASIGVFLVAPPCPNQKWIDVGTGAGFPGLVLKILCPDLDMSLLESARKRCIFLESSVRTLALGRVPIFSLRAETLIAKGEKTESYSVLTARAVSSLEETVRNFSPLVASGGRIITFKGPGWRDEVTRVRDGGLLESRGLELESVTRIPWTSGHLLVLKRGRVQEERGARTGEAAIVSPGEQEFPAAGERAKD